MKRNVLVLIYNPVTPDGRKLSQYMGWNDPAILADELRRALGDVSWKQAEYNAVATVEFNHFPTKINGYEYPVDKFISDYRTGTADNTETDYRKLIYENSVTEKINLGLIHEVWVFAPPFAGLYESRMIGRGAFWCNAPALVSLCHKVPLFMNLMVPSQREIHRVTHLGILSGASPLIIDTPRFVVMGFNYERGLAEALHSYGHRVESIMAYLFGRWNCSADRLNLWEQFTGYEKVWGGHSACGNVHYPPNGASDYDYSNQAQVWSDADQWLLFPFAARGRLFGCPEWKCDHEKYMRWWLGHLPRAEGRSGLIANNWWQYVLDTNSISPLIRRASQIWWG